MLLSKDTIEERNLDLHGFFRNRQKNQKWATVKKTSLPQEVFELYGGSRAFFRSFASF